MKNAFNFITTSALVLMFSSASLAQDVSFGGKAGFGSYLGTGFNPIVIGVQGDWIKDDQIGLRFSFDFGFTSKDGEGNAHARSSIVIPQSIDVTYTSKLKTFDLGVDGRKYFGNAEYDDGGFYGFLGVGITIAKIQTTYDYGIYSNEIYSATGFEGENDPQTFFQYMLRGGLGYEIDMDFGKLFFEAKLNFPANNVGGVPIPVDIGPMVMGSIGVRI
jgi:hypothetical protein